MNATAKPRMTRREFAAAWGVTERCVDKWRMTGKILWYRIGGKIYVIPPDEQLIAQQRAAV